MSRAANTQLTTLVTSAGAGGYTLPPELVAAHDTFVAVKALTIPTPPTLDSETAAARIVTAAAAGKPVDLMALATEVAEMELGQRRHEQARHIMVLAVEQAGDRAQHLAADLVEKVITKHLRPALLEVYAQAREVGAALDGHSLDNPHAIITAPAKVRNAYASLPELVARRSTILTARRLINTLGYRDPKHDGTGLYADFKTPLALFPQWKPPARIPPLPAPADPAARLLWTVGPEGTTASPWLPTIAEQDQAWMDQFGEAAKTRQGQAGWARVL